MNTRNMKLLALTLGLSFSLIQGATADEIKRGKEALSVSKYGEYRLLGGDSACEGSLVLQKIKVKISGKVMNATELVASDMASDDYIWRRGMSTLFVNINGKTVVDRDQSSSHRQGLSTTYEASFEDNVLTGLEENKTTYALIPIDKKATLSTLAFDDLKDQFTLNQEISGEFEVKKSCLYEKLN